MGRDDKIYVYRTLKWGTLNYNVYYVTNYCNFQNLKFKRITLEEAVPRIRPSILLALLPQSLSIAVCGTAATVSWLRRWLRVSNNWCRAAETIIGGEAASPSPIIH